VGILKTEAPSVVYQKIFIGFICQFYVFTRFVFFAFDLTEMKKISSRPLMFCRLLTGKICAEASTRPFLPVCLLLLFVFSFTTPAQQDNVGWKLDKTVNNVSFYHSQVACNGKKVILLKLANQNLYKVVVSWNELFVTKQIKEKTAGIAGQKELVLTPGEIYASGCNESKNRNLIILPADISPAYEADVEKFEFSDVTVSPAN
jgi:hypothetical protein